MTLFTIVITYWFLTSTITWIRIIFSKNDVVLEAHKTNPGIIVFTVVVLSPVVFIPEALIYIVMELFPFLKKKKKDPETP